MEEHDSYHKKETEAYLTFRKSVSNLIEVEQATVISFIHKTSNLQQVNILDFGCGSGLYSRLLRKMTRGDVYGTDISESMLETAKSLEDKNSANQIIYKRADLIEDSLCSVLEVSEGFFDVVITTWVLCYSENVASLKKMVKNIAKPLKSGGKVYGITMNPDMTEQDFKNQYKYHRAYVPVDKTKSQVSNEDKLIFTMFDANTGEKTMEVPVYYYDKETLKRVFEEEGFRVDIFGPVRELSIKPEIYEDRNTGVYFELTKIK